MNEEKKGYLVYDHDDLLEDVIVRQFNSTSHNTIKKGMKLTEFDKFRRDFYLKYETMRAQVKKEVDNVINRMMQKELVVISRDFIKFMKK
jgi:hypothetical protein